MLPTGDINLPNPKPIPELELEPLETIDKFLGLTKLLEGVPIPVPPVPIEGEEDGAKLLLFVVIILLRRELDSEEGVILLGRNADGGGETGFLIGEIGRDKERRRVEGGGGGNIAPEIDFDLGTIIALVEDEDDEEEGGIIDALGLVPVVELEEGILGEGVILALDNLPVVVVGGGSTAIEVLPPTFEVDLIKAGEEAPVEDEVTEDLPETDNGLTIVDEDAEDKEGLEIGRVALVLVLVLLLGREAEDESGREAVDDIGREIDARDREGLDGVGD